MQRNLKNNKGSVSLFILLSCLFFLVIVTGVAVSLKNKDARVDAEIAKVKASYEKDVGNEESVYNEKISNKPQSNLTPEEQTALQTNGIAEIPHDSITNDNLKDLEKIKAVITGDAPIPVDSTYVEGTVDTGVVIKYKNSEFVWVPVPVTQNNDLYVKGTTKSMARKTTGKDANDRDNYQGVLYDYSGTGDSTTSNEKTSYGQSTTSYRESALLDRYDQDAEGYTNYNMIGITENSLQQEYNKMIESVSKYGGFFVGRYETSIDGSTVASIADATPMNASSSSGNMWYGMYDKQSKFATSSDKLASSMIWGSQYDAMLNWSLEGEDKAHVTASNNALHNYGNTSSLLTRTTTENDTATGLDKINNIYDLEGNLWEWTQEANNITARIYRGGGYNGSISPSYRGSGSNPFDTGTGLGSRISLYIK